MSHFLPIAKYCLAMLLLSGKVFGQHTFDFDTYNLPNNQIVPSFDTIPLDSGVMYAVDAEGTFSIWVDFFWSNPCGAVEPMPIFPSLTTPQTNGPVGFDAAFIFALPEPVRCAGKKLPEPSTRIEISLDGGQSWFFPNPLLIGYNPQHKYQYRLIGQGHPLGVRQTSAANGDDYGVLRYTIQCADTAQAGFGVSIQQSTVTLNSTASRADSVVYDYGDGIITTDSVHTFDQTGTYTICQVAYNSCRNDTLCLDIEIACAVDSHTFFFDTYNDQDNKIVPSFDTLALDSGVRYTIEAQGTYSIWVAHYWSPSSSCGIAEPLPIFPSPFVTNGTVGFDPSFEFAYARSHSCVSQTLPKASNRIELSLDNGRSWFVPTPLNPYTTSHTYTYQVIGKGYPMGVRQTSDLNSDDYGLIRYRFATGRSANQAIAGFGTKIQGSTVIVSDSSINADSVMYDYGDGILTPSPRHIYKFAEVYTICQYAFGACGHDTSCIEVNLLDPQSIDLLTASGISLYPNPAEGHFYVSSNGPMLKYLFLYNPLGQLCRTYNLSPSNEHVLELNAISPGIYTLLIQTDEQTYWAKLEVK